MSVIYPWIRIVSLPSSETTAEPATIDRVFAALATETSRSVLAYFEASDSQTASIDDLTEYIAARQSASDARTPAQLRVRLHHTDLPKLDDAGLIDYDPRTTTVRYREEHSVKEWTAIASEVLM